MEVVEIDDVIADVVDEMRRLSSTHTIELDTRAGVEITADKDRIRQVLTNLIMNAVKFSPQADRIIVRSRWDETSREVTVSVQDFGIGIPRAQQSRVFERFYQVNRTNSAGIQGPGGDESSKSNRQMDTFPGLGLGLYISSQIIARHDGRIWIESEENQGTTFNFTLPA